MDIIENSEGQVVRLETEPPAYWWENEERPQAFTCRIQVLSTQGTLDFCISLDTLLTITRKAKIFKGEIQDLWSYPVTYCCGKRNFREHTTRRFVGEHYRITCKKGYGCKTGKKVS